MSKRTRAAWQLCRRLEMDTGIGVKVIWDHSADSGGWGWQVHWSDGPSVPAMRAIAEWALREILGLDPGRRFATPGCSSSARSRWP
jgi:hypothetical protein